MVPLSKLRRDFESGDLPKSEFIDNAAEIHRGLFQVCDALETSGVHRIELTPAGVLYELDGSHAKFRFKHFDKRIAPIESLNFGPYEPEVLSILTRLADAIPDVPIFDIGANIGWYSVQLAIKYPGRSVVAFEPSPTTFTQLRDNVVANALSNVQLVNLGLGEAPTEGFLADVPEVSGAAYVADHKTDKPISIDTLDNFCARENIAPGLIKADVEGFELFVLAGAGTVTKSARPAWVMELLRKWSARFGYHPNDVLAMMSAWGYVCFAIGASGLRAIDEVTAQSEETNYLFLHREAHRELVTTFSREA
ncbi:MAG: FkbM family methyltransferase [Fimbriimonadaceae bacterium]